MLPEDSEVREAVDPLAPEQMRFLPDNCHICSCQSLVVTSLGGGGYDGDVIFISTDPALARLVANSPDGRELPHASQRKPCSKGPGGAQHIEYLNYCRRVDTPSSRGTHAFLQNEPRWLPGWRDTLRRGLTLSLLFLSAMIWQQERAT